MSAHSNGSGPRSNSYSENRFTNWAEYEPWGLEIQAVFKRFDGKIAKRPKFPKIIELKPLPDFRHACSAREVEAQLLACPAEFLQGLRAVFLLSGTMKQLKSWKPGVRYYGHYWNNCVFLHALPYAGDRSLDWWRRFYLRDVLIHEIGHHVDKHNDTRIEREKFADRFAKTYG